LGFCVYIVASQRNGTLYIGSTDNLARRIYEHKEKLRPGFTKTYGVDKLWSGANLLSVARMPSAASGG
jgi:putative endonuclease